MKIKSLFLVDISGKVSNYDNALHDALLQKCPDIRIRYLIPGHGLLCFIPQSLRRSSSTVKHVIKVLEICMNYLYLCILACLKKPDVIHMEWLPLMDIGSIEIPILKIIRKLSPDSRLILTVHNIYPHRMDDSHRKRYNSKFRKACSSFDDFIVHTNISKSDVVGEFGLNPENVHVCCHGVFVPKGVVPSTTGRNNGKLHILQFGAQLYYKGTDLLVEAVAGLDKEHKEKVCTRIIGGISKDFLEELKMKDKDGSIEWRPYFLSDEDLYKEIDSCDMVVLPYRVISQSGVLLLSIYFGKLIICSDIPSFVETMRGNEDGSLDSELFFRTEEPESLRALIVRYIDHLADEKAVRARIEKLRGLYTWESAAEATLRVYEK